MLLLSHLRVTVLGKPRNRNFHLNLLMLFYLEIEKKKKQQKGNTDFFFLKKHAKTLGNVELLKQISEPPLEHFLNDVLLGN